MDVSLMDKVPSVELRERMGIELVSEVFWKDWVK